MREQYDTTGLHAVELEAADCLRSQFQHLVQPVLRQKWPKKWTPRPRPEELPPVEREERSEAADRRWWAARRAELAHALSSPSLAAGHQHRAAKRGLAAERVSLLVVAERDKWRCGICGKLVGKTVKGKRSASFDHIVPISQGGGNLYSNIQLAHLECNLRKNAQANLPSQMRLF